MDVFLTKNYAKILHLGPLHFASGEKDQRKTWDQQEDRMLRFLFGYHHDHVSCNALQLILPRFECAL